MFKSTISRIAQPAILPDFDRSSGLPAFTSVRNAIDAYNGDDAIHVLYPRVIAEAAATFLNGFPGTVLYAVKANPHPAVLKILWTSGVRHFDVASIREIDLVQSVARDARLFLMHPVKSRKTIRHAYACGVRDFSFDCDAELTKIIEETDGAADLNLHLRLITPKSGGSAMPLAGKFGATREDAITCLQTARRVSQNLGICFHVGSQCMDPQDYYRTIAYVRDLVDTAKIHIDSLDCGGGFPVAYPGMTPPPMADYFNTIDAALTKFGFDNIAIFGEPGRALCAEGGSTLARVELRKGNDLYINDGSYGSLFDAAQCSWKFPVKSHAPTATDDQIGFRFFGPTCDSLDVMKGPFHLPADIKEGDWIEICHLGAYGQALATDFNGFQSDATVAVLS
jgi:ornithine decarboxylase